MLGIKQQLIVATACCVCLLVPFAHADAKAQQIMAREYAASHGYGSYLVDVTMTLIAKNGKQRERKLSIAQMETPQSITKTLIHFSLPRAISGTGLLTYSHAQQEDEQWIFIPGLNRTKRIAARDRSGAFVGSAFSYEDLADHALAEYTYRWLREVPCPEASAGLTCDVIERTPLDPYSGYTHHHVWVDQTHHKIRQATLFDGEQVIKELSVPEYAAFTVGERDLLFPTRMHMQNVKTGRGTTLSWSTYQFDRALSETRDFSLNALRRNR